MIYNTLVDTTGLVPVRVFTATRTGAQDAVPSDRQDRAVTSMIICNTSSITLTDETANSIKVNIHLIRRGETYGDNNMIVKELAVPAGETVFFSDERIILDGGDYIAVGTDVANKISVTVSSMPV